MLLDSRLFVVTLLYTAGSESWSLSGKTKKDISTLPCNVIWDFNPESKIKLIGSKWMISCPDNRYIKAVSSVVSSEPFIKGKCYGSEVSTLLSWEISDLTYLTGGESTADKTWNVECERYCVITGMSTSFSVLFDSTLPLIFLKFNFKLQSFAKTIETAVEFNLIPPCPKSVL